MARPIKTYYYVYIIKLLHQIPKFYTTFILCVRIKEHSKIFYFQVFTKKLNDTGSKEVKHNNCYFHSKFVVRGKHTVLSDFM